MMRKLLCLLPLLTGACLSDPDTDARPANGHVEPRPEAVDVPDVDEDPILEGMTQWREGLVAGDFERFHDATANYGRARWLFDALKAASAQRRGFPRVGELTDDMIVEINQWYDINFNNEARNEPIQDLAPRFLRDPWLKNVLCDYFDSTWQDQAMYIRDWGFHLKSAQPREAWFIADVPGTAEDPLIQMVLEDGRWRVRYMISAKAQ